MYYRLLHPAVPRPLISFGAPYLGALAGRPDFFLFLLIG